jgi:hypothetical protein
VLALGLFATGSLGGVSDTTQTGTDRTCWYPLPSRPGCSVRRSLGLRARPATAVPVRPFYRLVFSKGAAGFVEDESVTLVLETEGCSWPPATEPARSGGAAPAPTQIPGISDGPPMAICSRRGRMAWSMARRACPSSSSV